jgi:NAD(P)-dependent dehydrogenase (short-subunit alcohol dehydrogenase family)
MYPELNGKVVLITGAGGSLGKAVALRLSQEQARLVLIDRNEAALSPLATLPGLSQDALRLPGDLTQQAEVEAMVAQAVEAVDKIDVLVNVAGGFRFSGPMHESKSDDLDFLFQINVKTAYLMSAAVAKRMVEMETPGRIINVGARAALAGAAGMAAYTASKAAVLRLTESMAAELLDKRITVNAVLPSTIDTPPNRQAMPKADFSKWVSPESLADVIAFLASDASRDISGAAIPVYGRA